MTDEQWTTSFESVYLGAVRLAREVAQVLPDGGTITFVLSSSGPRPHRRTRDLETGSDQGLAMIAKTLADELGPAGIRVNGLLPGADRHRTGAGAGREHR